MEDYFILSPPSSPPPPSPFPHPSQWKTGQASDMNSAPRNIHSGDKTGEIIYVPFLRSGFIWPCFFVVCGFDPGMTQISRYSIKLTTFLISELPPCNAISLLSHIALSIFLLSFIRFLTAEFLSNSYLLFFPQMIFFFFFCNSVSSSCSQISVNLLHLSDDLLLEDGQDGVIVTNLLEHDTTVELVAHFLKVEPAGHKKQTCLIK